MGKMTLAGTSLVAALPGGFLAYLMLMSVLNSLQPMPMVLKVASLLALVTAAALTLFPAYVLIWYGGGGKTAEKSPKPESKATAGEEESAETRTFTGDDFGEAFGEGIEDEEDDPGAFELDDEEEVGSGAELDFAEDVAGVDEEDFDEAFEFDEFEEEEK